MTFVDTCVVIEYLRGNIQLDKSDCYINSIVLMELYMGVKNKRELHILKSQLQGFRLIDINQNIMDLSTKIVDMYGLSHNAKIQDSIIAATCLINKLPLATYNIKDFKYIENLELINILYEGQK
jgi:predicted nucleic acid-binding protein